LRRRRIYETVEVCDQGLPALYLKLHESLSLRVLPPRLFLGGLQLKLRKPLAVGLSLPVALTQGRAFHGRL